MYVNVEGCNLAKSYNLMILAESDKHLHTYTHYKAHTYYFQRTYSSIYFEESGKRLMLSFFPLEFKGLQKQGIICCQFSFLAWTSFIGKLIQ